MTTSCGASCGTRAAGATSSPCSCTPATARPRRRAPSAPARTSGPAGGARGWRWRSRWRWSARSASRRGTSPRSSGSSSRRPTTDSGRRCRPSPRASRGAGARHPRGRRTAAPFRQPRAGRAGRASPRCGGRGGRAEGPHTVPTIHSSVASSLPFAPPHDG